VEIQEIFWLFRPT